MPLQPGTYAVFNTNEGKIVARLFEKDAPKTVTNFVELAEGKREWTHPVGNNKSSDKLYDGTIFHRVIPDFMIQGGDFLNGDGTGSTTIYGTQKFADENFKYKHEEAGLLSMAFS